MLCACVCVLVEYFQQYGRSKLQTFATQEFVTDLFIKAQ